MNIFKRIYMFLYFSVYYAWEMIVSNYRIFIDIITPTDRYSEQIVEIPISIKKRHHLVILANLITMTPGTICLDYDQEKEILSIHVLYKEDALTMKDKVQNVYWPYVKEVFSW